MHCVWHQVRIDRRENLWGKKLLWSAGQFDAVRVSTSPSIMDVGVVNNFTSTRRRPAVTCRRGRCWIIHLSWTFISAFATPSSDRLPRVPPLPVSARTAVRLVPLDHYYAPGRGTKYCDRRLSVYPLAYRKDHIWDFTKFSVLVTSGHGSVLAHLLATQYVMYFRFCK